MSMHSTIGSRVAVSDKKVAEKPVLLSLITCCLAKLIKGINISTADEETTRKQKLVCNITP